MERQAPRVQRKTDGDCNEAAEIPPRGGKLRPTEAGPKLGNSPWQKDLDYQNDDCPNEGNRPSRKDQLVATFAFQKVRFHYLELSR